MNKPLFKRGDRVVASINSTDLPEHLEGRTGTVVNLVPNDLTDDPADQYWYDVDFRVQMYVCLGEDLERLPKVGILDLQRFKVVRQSKLLWLLEYHIFGCTCCGPCDHYARTPGWIMRGLEWLWNQHGSAMDVWKFVYWVWFGFLGLSEEFEE